MLTAVLLFLAGVTTIIIVFWFYGRELPDINTIDDYRPKQHSIVYNADGEVIALWTDNELIYRTVIPLNEIPEHMRLAMIAAEDAEFYSHSGLDYAAVVRAAYSNIRSGSFSQGFSTITQQVVKNLILTPERTIRRKVQEVLLAFRLEDRLSKDEILTLYLNEVYFGGNRYGIEAASQYYFGHSASQLDLPEAALLAGIIQSPERYQPYRHAEEALARREYVLGQMWENGFIEESTYRSALEAPLELNRNGYPYLGEAPYFTSAVRRLLYEELGRDIVNTGGLHIYTTLSSEHQQAAEEAVHVALRDYDERHDMFEIVRQLELLEIEDFRHDNRPQDGLTSGDTLRVVVLGVDEESIRVGVGRYETDVEIAPFSRINPSEGPLGEVYSVGDVIEVTAVSTVTSMNLSEHPDILELALPPSAQAGFVSIDPQTRQVLAIVGGYDYWDSPFNRAIQANRQTGSAFKPFVYGVALADHLVTPASIVRDEPVPFRLPNGNIWNPQNSDGEYLGAIPLRTALARSRNVVAVRLLEEIGLRRAGEFARDAGISVDLTQNLTMALGSSEMSPLELVNAYATIASGGWVQAPIIVTRVENHLGETIWEAPYEPERGMDEAVAFLITDMMTSVVEWGTATAANEINRPAAGKTGTTNGPRDAWFVGFVPQLVAGGWVGFDDNRELGIGEYGGRAALPMWLNYMQTVLEDEPVLEFPMPEEGLVVRRIDPSTGLLAQPDAEDAVFETFLEDNAPTRYAPESHQSSPDETWLRGTEEGSGGAYDDF